MLSFDDDANEPSKIISVGSIRLTRTVKSGISGEIMIRLN